MNGTDCSIGSNPLMQINKHSQESSSLLKGNHFQQYQNSNGKFEGSSQGFRTGNNAISQENKEYMKNFMNNNVPSSSFARPVNLDRAHLENGNNVMKNQSGNSSWVSQFSNDAESQHRQQIYNNKRMMAGNNQWSGEFKDSQKQSPQQQQQSQFNQDVQSSLPYQMNHPMYSQNMFAGGMMGSMSQNSLLQQGRQQNLQNQTTNENWEKHFKELEEEVTNNLKINTDEPLTKEGEVDQEEKVQEADEQIEQYQDVFQEVWDSINQDAEDLLPDNLVGKDAWNNDHQKYFSDRINSVEEYQFDKKNEYMNNPNSYEIGCILMENGAKLSEAALAFEAAVQENPEHVDAWLKLGLVQIQNEKEINGITALEKCLKLDPKNLEAMKNLAISYVNEGYDVSAFTMLNRWIETRYPHLLENTHGIELDSDQDRYVVNEIVTKQFLQVANKLETADADVQLGLGLLFYSNNEFDKTIDCFKAALKVSPNDELLWNRLGASLANSNRSEEAIQAYHKALNLKPSFVRARYNLAVSSINIGCYKEAAQYLLTALSMHEVEGLKGSKSNYLNNLSDGYNNNIMETLKRAFMGMDRHDLMVKVLPGMDLDQFRTEFKF
ncbi:hypothetical protein Kpol_1031p64 [Vanderwaltozyma polyspora DSM 70294]|uniref:Uncharacterized protein n=1 Tax=Vanderwaltozyma polyspora (strain ATCC 22028 / DSM 70294 / BCRC 21397 / CBS 2163 / NBRC 10782 / NRRL Y-8283 / UCD 57-17) TaxID=436907 RepID=A7THZ5_VANPO|nr:uncharacterized protein Kpol_1031p64 [Vanderwaltozyma polyspora DSM 70294]EDO18157.1 hypothetical protein Kpol_1031p64 [Vanderwaltozyma polyspora DSM 70294]